MHDLHIDDFCKDAAQILLTLFQHFPQALTLYIEDICGPDTPDEFGLHSPRHMACFSAAMWLAEEGLIRLGQSVRQEAFEDAVLTSRSFNYLVAPASSTLSTSRAKELRELMVKGSSEQFKSHFLKQLQNLTRTLRE